MEKSNWSPSSALALMSGGMDSTFAVYWTKHHHPEALGRGVFINYGQKGAAWEWQAAKRIMDMLDLPASYLDARQLLRPLLDGAIMAGIGQDPAKDPHAKDSRGRPATFVPGRNMIHFSLLAPLIDHYEYTQVIGGWNAVDVEYPDCSQEFLDAVVVATSLALGRGHGGLGYTAPALKLTKAEEVEIATKRGWEVPWHLTRSCYKDDMFSCGACDSCLVRAAAFYTNGIRDPLYTESAWKLVVENLNVEGYLDE